MLFYGRDKGISTVWAGLVQVREGRVGQRTIGKKTQCPPSQQSIETFFNRCNFQVINNFKQREPHFAEKCKTIFLSDLTTKIMFLYKNFYFGMTRIKVNLCRLEVCVPKLVWNKTRQDETGGQFPNWRDQYKTTSLWSRCSGKSEYIAVCCRALDCITYVTPPCHFHSIPLI